MTASTDADALVERISGSVLGALDVYAVYVGDRLGYYDILSEEGPLTSGQLATRASTTERYAREWLEQQTVTGIVLMAEDADEAGHRKFGLPPGHAEALTDRLSLNYIAPFARMISAAGMKLSAIVAAHRTGHGVPWDDFGDDMREAQGDMNRPFFENLLAEEWFGSVPELHERLVAGGRVADIGCGHGWSAIGLAKGYPNATIDGYDLDGPSVESARRHAENAGVGERAVFHAMDAGDPSVVGDYDIVTAFECIHDMGDPVSALATMRRLAGDSGIVVVMDEKVSEAFSPDGDEVEQLMYGFSNFICLPDGLSHKGSVGTGTVMRPDTLREYAREAGFADLEVLPIDTELWRFYKLV
ncbi:MAG: class I SAM-dependent methyltransferase [bacterium]|nr:class I SAM-dependent methyltransferase [bacterium]